MQNGEEVEGRADNNTATHAGCTHQQLWKLLASNLPAEVRELSAPLKQLVLSNLRARSDVEVKAAPAGMDRCAAPSSNVVCLISLSSRWLFLRAGPQLKAHHLLNPRWVHVHTCLHTCIHLRLCWATMLCRHRQDEGDWSEGVRVETITHPNCHRTEVCSVTI